MERVKVFLEFAKRIDRLASKSNRVEGKALQAWLNEGNYKALESSLQEFLKAVEEYPDGSKFLEVEPPPVIGKRWKEFVALKARLAKDPKLLPEISAEQDRERVAAYLGGCGLPLEKADMKLLQQVVGTHPDSTSITVEETLTFILASYGYTSDQVKSFINQSSSDLVNKLPLLVVEPAQNLVRMAFSAIYSTSHVDFYFLVGLNDPEINKRWVSISPLTYDLVKYPELSKCLDSYKIYHANDFAAYMAGAGYTDLKTVSVPTRVKLAAVYTYEKSPSGLAAFVLGHNFND